MLTLSKPAPTGKARVRDDPPSDSAAALAALFDEALPQVYGYLKPRCGNFCVAEDLAAETFLAACDSAQRGQVASVTVGWLIGIARHKLVDHWRREARHDRDNEAIAALTDQLDDPWPSRVDASAIATVLDQLSAINRAALTLRYLDGLSVTEVATLLERTVPATDQVLARARTAFRAQFPEDDR
jgi:RNA polymerase sigma-70 factor, ECF subfamily